MKCPSCLYTRSANDTGVHDGTCPSCGIAYAKWNEKLAALQVAEEPPVPLAPLEHKVPLSHRLWEQLFFVSSDRHESTFWGNAVLFAFFFIYGWRFIFHGVDADFIGNALLHYPDLAMHEFGHMIFRPFGEFTMFLGGSLTQILMPFCLMLYFTFSRHENFSSALCLWWTGQNFIDVSPYIQDAQARALPLVGGGGPASHDWWNILGSTGQLGAANFYAHLSFFIGCGLILLSFFWAGMLFYTELLGREVIREKDDDAPFSNDAS